MCERKILFYEYDPEWGVINSWKDTERALADGMETIPTTQMGFLSMHSHLRDLGYRIFIMESPGIPYEIKLGDDNERTSREIRSAHNLFKMWMAGEFAKKEEADAAD